MCWLNLFYYLLAIGGAFVFSRTYIGWFGEYLLWAVMLLPPVLTLFSIPSMRALRIRCSAPTAINLGEGAELSIRFSCRRLLPVRACRFTLRIKNVFTGQETVQEMRFALVADSVSLVTLDTQSSGMLLCTLENMKVYSYLGLLALRAREVDAVGCIVMPRPQAPANMDSLDALPPVFLRYRPKPGGGFAEEHELRLYRPGDSVNSIHWKLSSKTDEIIIREPLEPVDEGTAVLLQSMSEADIAHLYWLSLRLCAANIKHSIHFSGSQIAQVENETDCLRAMRRLLSCPGKACGEVNGSYSRVFIVDKGEVRWR